MKAPVLYRSAAVLILLFAVGHTLGFRQSDPSWGADAMLASMRSSHFDLQGFSRSYWDLFRRRWIFCLSVFLLLAAVLAWQLGGLPAETLARMRGTAWALAFSFVALTILAWRYFFLVPLVFSLLIAVCLILAAWLSPKSA